MGWRLPFRVQLDASNPWTRLAGRLRGFGDFHCRLSWRPAGRHLHTSNFWRELCSRILRHFEAFARDIVVINAIYINIPNEYLLDTVIQTEAELRRREANNAIDVYCIMLYNFSTQMGNGWKSGISPPKLPDLD